MMRPLGFNHKSYVALFMYHGKLVSFDGIGICTFHTSSLSFTLYGSLFPLHFSFIYQMISLNLKSLLLFLY